jgi:hypothetical protein
MAAWWSAVVWSNDLFEMNKALLSLFLLGALVSCKKSTFELDELDRNPFDPDFNGPHGIVIADGSFLNGDMFYLRFRIDRTSLDEGEHFYVYVTRPNGEQAVYRTLDMEFDVFTDAVPYPGPGITLCWQVGVGNNTASGGRVPFCDTTP